VVKEFSTLFDARCNHEEPLVPEPSASEVEMATEKLNRHKSPTLNQIPAELIKAGSRTTRSEIHKLINSTWNKEELPGDWKSLSLYLFIRKVIKQTVSFTWNISVGVAVTISINIHNHNQPT